MKKSLFLILILYLGFIPAMPAGEETPDYRRIDVQPAQNTSLKNRAGQWLSQHREELGKLNREIWAHAEPAMLEYRSSEALARLLEEEGFTVIRGVAGMPTAFTATWGEGKPVIGFLAEYDALPGLSQDRVPYLKPLIKGAAGHGCGHNLFGVASTAAALATRAAMKARRLPGTVKLFGCPAEETVVGKVFMAREGIFRGLSCCLHWHPSSKNRVSLGSSNALKQFEVEFFGETAHSAGDPWNGRSALDAVELTNIGLNYLREHLKPTARIHYVIQKGGDAPNVVPGYARGWYYVRDYDWQTVKDNYHRVEKIIQGAALMTGTESRIHTLSGVHQVLPNHTGARIMYANLLLTGPPEFSGEDQEFARTIQKNLGVKAEGLATDVEPLQRPLRSWGGGSTDVAEVSWLTPTMGLNIASKPLGTPGHHWSMVACGGMSIGHRALMTAARVLSYTALDLFQSPHVIEEMRKEWRERLGSLRYESPLPDDLDPPVKPDPEKNQ